MSNNGGMSRGCTGVSARLFVAVTMGPRLYLSAADRQIGSIPMQRGGADCLGWL